MVEKPWKVKSCFILMSFNSRYICFAESLMISENVVSLVFINRASSIKQNLYFAFFLCSIYTICSNKHIFEEDIGRPGRNFLVATFRSLP